ncbi:unnamed protein product [Closterium sp. NIES-65]|nr:unnamed protein product [Closterium sp. NIES-65]
MHSLEQPASPEPYLDDLPMDTWPSPDLCKVNNRSSFIVTEVPAPPSVAGVAQNLLISSICRRWRRLAKRHVTTLLVKEDLLVSREDLSAAVACFPNLIHLHISDNSVEPLNDAFLAHLASSCPKLTRLHNPGFTNLTSLTTLYITFSINHRHLSTLFHLPRLAHLFNLGPHPTLQPADAGIMTLPSCLKSLNFHRSCPGFNTIFPSASPFTGLEELLITHCSELESLPDHIDDLLPCLRKLTIRACIDFAHLPESFVSLSRLETLIISHSGPFILPSNFGHLHALKVLVLESLSSLTELPPSFSYLTSLEKLSILHCYHIRQFSAGFSRLTALKVLDLSLGLALPEDVGGLASLKALRLNGTPLPTSFTDFCSLTILELNGCSLSDAEALGELSSLQELKIIDSVIRTLPTSLMHLLRLQSLEVTGCRTLSEVPFRLDTLVGLKRLELTECEQLSITPAGFPPSLEALCLGPFMEGAYHFVDISELSQLRVLKLNRVGVICGPAVSSMLSGLEQLEMHLEGGSRELPVPLTFLPRLRSLLIEAPGFCSLPESMAASLPQLLQLELRSWTPENLPGSILELSSLTSLRVQAPHLVSLPQGMSRLSRLRKLELIDCNALQHLPNFLKQLHQLVLYNSAIRSVPANFVRLV